MAKIYHRDRLRKTTVKSADSSHVAHFWEYNIGGNNVYCDRSRNLQTAKVLCAARKRSFVGTRATCCVIIAISKGVAYRVVGTFSLGARVDGADIPKRFKPNNNAAAK